MTYAIGFLSYEWLRKSQIDGLAACIEGFLHHFVFMLFIQYRTLTKYNIQNGIQKPNETIIQNSI